MSGMVALTLAAYVASARAGGEAVEATTEVAALVVLARGVLAGLGSIQLASGATAVFLVVLSENSRLHDAVKRIGRADAGAAFQFAMLALVVHPLLPTGSYGPLGGVRPLSLWIVVLVFSALTFTGYQARRAIGATRGLGVTGLLGGSSPHRDVHFGAPSQGQHLSHSARDVRAIERLTDAQMNDRGLVIRCKTGTTTVRRLTWRHAVCSVKSSCNQVKYLAIVVPRSLAVAESSLQGATHSPLPCIPATDAAGNRRQGAGEPMKRLRCFRLVSGSAVSPLGGHDIGWVCELQSAT